MTEDEIKAMQFENQRLKSDLLIASKNWKFENERLQLSLNARLEEVGTLSKKLKTAEARINELTVLLNIATKQNEAEIHDDNCRSLWAVPNDCKCDCWISKVKKELCR